MNSDPYSILSVSPKATPDEIRAAYRRAAMRWHPDKNPDDPSAAERFKDTGTAYSVLSDPQKRAQYDRAAGDSGNLFRQQHYQSEDRYNYAQAAEMFFAEMVRLAGELTMKNVPSDKIASELIKRGCPEAIASTIAADVEHERKTLVRTHARKAIVRAVVSFLAGGILTALLWGLGYFVLIGPVLVVSGVYNAARALYYFSTGRVPREGYQVNT